MEEFNIDKLTENTPEILLSINELLHQLNPDLRDLTETELENILVSSSTNLYVLKKGQTIIGMITLVIYRTPSGARGYIEDVVVEEKYRGQGLGKKLLLHAITVSKELELEYVGLTSRPERAAANKMYQSLGFKKRDTNVYRYIL
jgi:ribosomal protein S18 acetylase RimI-like enzyme